MPSRSAVSLTVQQQELIERLVRSGRFDGVNDVVSTGLRLLEEREKQAANFIWGLEREIEKGINSGAAVPMESSDELRTMFRWKS
ncbi:MAG: type II toxin-antitoxin system ParD family antitoxin [Shinella sp.]|jgi:antitoxin ParD1/3/4|nr:type II toxin-antitoxin system ParD family antitoxin [Shinella sp.]